MDPDTVIQRIADIDIQGATSIAEAGVELLQALAADGADQEQLDSVADRLNAARPTEPMLRNAVHVARRTGDYGAVLDTIRTGTADVAAQWDAVLADGDTVYTHCHSSTVVQLLTAAAEAVTVTAAVTETRPLYQGWTTAAELADAGIPVTLAVDGAAQQLLAGADVMLIGADAVTADGTVVNKVGSGLVARVAAAVDVPVHVCTHSWKAAGDRTPSLEARDPAEVWADAPDGVTVQNHAFERVQPEHITSIVSELGQHAPAAFDDAVRAAYPELDE